MIVDITVVHVRAGREDEFARAFHEAWRKLGKVKGLLRWHLVRGIEQPAHFVFVGEWKAIDDHHALMRTPQYGELLAAVGPYLEGSPEILHHTVVEAPKKGK